MSETDESDKEYIHLSENGSEDSYVSDTEPDNYWYIDNNRK